MKKILSVQFILIASTILIVGSSCSSPVNSTNDPHFTKDGLHLDSIGDAFIAQAPSSLSFYVEVSGSMNGFFRSNQATRFKKDVWSIVSNFGGNDVAVLSNAGTISGTYPITQFRSRMNSGGFVSNQETLVPTMVNSILSNLDYKNGQCAVLISDMKYSPEKQKDIKVLLTQYQTDIRNQIGKYPGISVCMIMASSEYLKANNTVAEEESPYYYVIFGKEENVAFMRNCISILLDDNDDYRESIEMGINYKAPSYSFGIPVNALQLYNEPTFTGFDTDFSDTCVIKLQLDLSNYRWMIADETILRQCLSVKSCYGCGVSIGDIKIDATNHYNKKFERRVVAIVELKVYDMFATTSDVIEWTLNHPDKLISDRFDQIMTSEKESDLAGSFSVDRFIGGVFNAIQDEWDKTPNRILISKK